MKLCDRCRVPDCLLNYGGKACQNARKQECPDVVFTHADKIREMEDEELADFLAYTWAIKAKAWHTDSGEVLAWLKEPEEEL